MNLSSIMDKLRQEYVIDAATVSGLREASLRLHPDDEAAQNHYIAGPLERIIRKKLTGYEPEAVNQLVKSAVEMITEEKLQALSMFDILRCAGILGYSSDRLARNLARWLEKSAGIQGGYELAQALAGILPHFDGRGENVQPRHLQGNLKPAKSKRVYTLSDEAATLYPVTRTGVDISQQDTAFLPDFSMDSIVNEYYEKQTERILQETGFDFHHARIKDAADQDFFAMDEISTSPETDYAEIPPVSVRLRRKLKASLPERITDMLDKKYRAGQLEAETALLALADEPVIPEAERVSQVELAPLPQPRSYPLIEDDTAAFPEETYKRMIGTARPNFFREGLPLRKIPLPKHLTFKTIAIAAIAGIFALSAMLAPTFINVNAGSVGQLGFFAGEPEKEDEDAAGQSLPALRQIGVPVLLYHHIRQDVPEDDSLAGVIISVDTFTRQMDYLKDNGYTTISLTDLYNYVLKGSELPLNSVVITFDDGYKDNFYYAYPVLRDRGFVAAVFAITDRTTVEPVPLDLGTEFVQKMSMEEMRLSADVFEFGSHTHNLHRLDGENRSELLTASREEILKDMMVSKRLLDTDYFAYPYGQYNQDTINYLKETGYLMAFINQPGYISTGDNQFTLPRIEIRGDISMQRFAEILEGKY